MAWTVLLHEEVERWYLDLAATDTKSSDLVTAAIDLLEEEGPTLGRPLVDRIHGSRHHNLKELRPGSTGTTEVRILTRSDRLCCLSPATSRVTGEPGTTRRSRLLKSD